MYRISRLYISLFCIFDRTSNTETVLLLENTISSPDLNIGTIFASFNSLGNMPVMKERLHIWTNGLFMQLCINFVMHGRKSFHPTALSLKLHIILPISSSVTAETKKFSDISTLIYALVHLSIEGISLAKVSPTFTKNVLNSLTTVFPSLITSAIVLAFHVD